MKLLIDPQTYNEQRYGGISRYHTEVFVALQKQGIEVDFPLVYSDNLHLKEYSISGRIWNYIANSKIFSRSVRRKIDKKFKQKNIDNTIKALQKQDFDVFVSTYYNPYFVEYLNDKPFVLTLHDMIHEILPQYFTDDHITVERKRALLHRATRIIAVSHNTKKDILHFYPELDAGKIDVVYLSQSIKIDQSVAVDLPENYILFVGNRTIYKNFIFFIRSIAPLLKDNPQLFVMCAGGNRFEPDEKQLLESLGISAQVMQRNFEDNELAAYYSNAKCFVFASEYEGFGIPVLESMACGCPVVLANHSSFPEVAGDAGVYFELNNAEDLKMKVAQLVENEVLRNEYSKKGLLQAEKFSWKKTAEDCLAVYKKALAE